MGVVCPVCPAEMYAVIIDIISYVGLTKNFWLCETNNDFANSEYNYPWNFHYLFVSPVYKYLSHSLLFVGLQFMIYNNYY